MSDSAPHYTLRGKSLTIVILAVSLRRRLCCGIRHVGWKYRTLTIDAKFDSVDKVLLRVHDLIFALNEVVEVRAIKRQSSRRDQMKEFTIGGFVRSLSISIVVSSYQGSAA
jgi:hypothetical protein